MSGRIGLATREPTSAPACWTAAGDTARASSALPALPLRVRPVAAQHPLGAGAARRCAAHGRLVPNESAANAAARQQWYERHTAENPSTPAPRWAVPLSSRRSGARCLLGSAVAAPWEWECPAPRRPATPAARSALPALRPTAVLACLRASRCRADARQNRVLPDERAAIELRQAAGEGSRAAQLRRCRGLPRFLQCGADASLC